MSGECPRSVDPFPIHNALLEGGGGGGGGEEDEEGGGGFGKEHGCRRLVTSALDR